MTREHFIILDGRAQSAAPAPSEGFKNTLILKMFLESCWEADCGIHSTKAHCGGRERGVMSSFVPEKRIWKSFVLSLALSQEEPTVYLS